MWADALLQAERAHLHRLLLWGVVSLIAGLVLLITAGRPRRSPLIFHFAAQTLAWGAVIAGVAAEELRSLVLRDLAGATRLDRFLWLNLGLDIGYVAVGAAIAATAWIVGRRQGGVGAGVAIVVQGLALAILAARLIVLLEQSA
ncbi:MAG: DUF6992 family protein [Gemmatimonadaceae bacterium]